MQKGVEGVVHRYLATQRRWECKPILVVAVKRKDNLGAITNLLPIKPGHSVVSPIQESIELALYPPAGQYAGIVRLRRQLVHNVELPSPLESHYRRIVGANGLKGARSGNLTDYQRQPIP